MCPFLADWLLRRRGRQKQLDCRQQIADVYWLSDISIASALKGVRFIFWRYEGGYGDDWNVAGLIALA
jgi:hypothetical protein